MPHKHTRKRDNDDKHFDLAPDRIAKPLPSFDSAVKEEQKKNRQKGRQEGRRQEQRQNDLKRTRGFTAKFREDDTPRAFARLMQLQAGQKPRSGLDDGETKKSRKKRKLLESDEDEQQPAAKAAKATVVDPRTGEELRILPGERMSDFAARVNQALPVGGLSRKGKNIDGAKERRTKTEKRMHKMYAEWREEEARRKEKLEEQQEKQEEEDEEKVAEHGGQDIHVPSSSRSKKKRMVGEVDDDEDDPWAVLKIKRDAPKGLHDVVQAPPSMKVVPKEKFKVRDGAKVSVANVPGASGMKSLKQREELGEARKEVIERYRAMMKGGGRL